MKILLRDVTLNFPNLWVPDYDFKNSQGDKKYFATFTFAPDSPAHKAALKAIETEAQEAFGPNWKDILEGIKGDPKSYCLRNGNMRSGTPGFEGNWFLKATSVDPIDVVDYNKRKLTEHDGGRARMYPGAIVNAFINIWADARPNKYGKAVRATLGDIQFVRDGTRLSAGKFSSADEFDDLSGEEVEEEFA